MNKLLFSDALRIYTNPLNFAIFIHGNDGEPKCFFSINQKGMLSCFTSKHIGTKEEVIDAVSVLLEDIITKIEKMSADYPEVLSQNIATQISVETEVEVSTPLNRELKEKIINSLRKNWGAVLHDSEWRRKWAA